MHGAWVDASGWKPVYEMLTEDGFLVTMVQEPETAFADDVAAAKRILDLPGWAYTPGRPLQLRWLDHYPSWNSFPTLSGSCTLRHTLLMSERMKERLGKKHPAF